MKSKILSILFLLVLCSTLVLAIDEQETKDIPEVNDFFKKMNSLDPIMEETKLVTSHGEKNLLKISQATIIDSVSRDSFTIQPEESLRIDYYKNGNINMEIYYNNEFNNTDEYYKAFFYDVRLTTRSLNPDINLDFTFTTTQLAETEFKRISLNNLVDLPKGIYPVEVTLTGRDITRRVHSDKAIFYFNVGIDANNTDLRYSIIDKDIKQKGTMKGIIWGLGIFILILFILGFLGYKKLTSVEEDDIYG